jgi:ornithine carbamoyltransferase
MKHFINLEDLSTDDLNQIINHATTLKKEYKSGQINKVLENKTLAMVFDKSSTRTRVSFEAGMAQLGGHALFLSERDIQLGRGQD